MRVFLPVLAAGLLAAADPTPPAVVSPTSLRQLDFMAGCWRGASGRGAVIDEYYTPPTDNLMLGVSRYTKGGRVTTFEFTTITAKGDSDLVLTPRPDRPDARGLQPHEAGAGNGRLEQSQRTISRS